MKTLTFMRHGKSSWEHDVSDDLRPLKSRGKKEAKLVAERFLKMNSIKVDAIISSHARRAHDTCKLFCKEIGWQEHEIKVNQLMYDFAGRSVLNVIKSLQNNWQHVVLFGHNHAFTGLVNMLGSKYIDNVPTSGLVSITFDIDNWEQIESGTTTLILFPKHFRD